MTAQEEIDLLHAKHKGMWLTKEDIIEYQRKANEINSANGQDIGEWRKLRIEFQEKFGLLEVEAINILRGYWVNEYLDKYTKIKNRIPLRRDKTERDKDANNRNDELIDES